MKYLIENIEFKQTKNSTAEKPQLYINMELSNPDDWFDAHARVAILDDNVVKGYRRILETTLKQPVAEGVVYDITTMNVPEKVKYFSGAVYVEFDLPQPMFRIWGSDFTDGAGVEHKAKDYICDKNGNPKLHKKVTVLCKKTYDAEQECWTWAKGWDPVGRANSMISAFFVAPTSGNTNEGAQTAPPQQMPPQQAPAQAPQQVQQPAPAPQPAQAPLPPVPPAGNPPMPAGAVQVAPQF